MVSMRVVNTSMWRGSWLAAPEVSATAKRTRAPCDLPIQLRRVCGGGTSFVDVCAEAEKLNADVLLVLTDMYGSFPEQCSVPTIWCSTEKSETTVPFGEVVHVECE